MSIMQVTHRWHQRNTFAFQTQTADMLAQQRQGFNN
ncbi:Uncharacterised protein [Salmonella enterica subsp. arizonae]|uniref:Uncharacterized protein n=1 Tax=Salmonella enterica subsp. arizonae TaxID=59203 RepID=A0A379TPG7_SALER|nr:Uncharacterised protein [Salmonella enterica subsp. arizonae]